MIHEGKYDKRNCTENTICRELFVTNFIKNFGCELTTKSYSFLRFSTGEGTKVRSNQNKKKRATDRYAAQIMPIAEKYLRVLTWRGILIGNRTMNYNYIRKIEINY